MSGREAPPPRSVRHRQRLDKRVLKKKGAAVPIDTAVGGFYFSPAVAARAMGDVTEELLAPSAGGDIAL